MDAYLTGLPGTRSDKLDVGLGGVHVPAGAGYAGDLGEGTDVSAIALGQTSRGRGETYTPLPGVLPTMDHLDYVQKFSTAGLLAIGFLILVIVGILNPRRAVNLIGTGAARQAGIR